MVGRFKPTTRFNQTVARTRPGALSPMFSNDDAKSETNQQLYNQKLISRIHARRARAPTIQSAIIDDRDLPFTLS